MERSNALLRQVGQFLGTNSIWTFRIMAGRFAIVTKKEEDYHKAIQELELKFSFPWKMEGQEYNLWANIRHSNQTSHFTKVSQITQLMELVHADQSGNNETSIKFLDDQYLENIYRQVDIEKSIEENLLTYENFQIVIQPLYSITNNVFDCGEVLLRYTHPELGPISPVEFIPLAEKRGLIKKVDEMVLRKTCLFLKENPSAFDYGMRKIEINISALSFEDELFPEKVKSIVEEYEINPETLVFEITETAATFSHKRLGLIMAELKEYGICSVLDDFGSGYANLVQVLNLPFCGIKLDRSLLNHLDSDNNIDPIISDFVRIFNRSGLQTVIEGAETIEQIEYLKQINCDYIQGYYYSKPLSIQEYLCFIRRQNS